MRIIAGRYGGRRLKVPPGIIRPAMDQMRESVFASLGNLEGARFLDLFAGSGAVGLEAASRGAALVVFVESDRKKIATLQENITALGLELRRGAPTNPAETGAAGPEDAATAHVVAWPVERYLASGRADRLQADTTGPGGERIAAMHGDGERTASETFDCVFADPPFPYQKRAKVLYSLGTSPRIVEGAVVMIHYPAESPLPDAVPGLEHLRDRRFGRSVVTFFRRSSVS